MGFDAKGQKEVDELEYEGCQHFDDMTGYCNKKHIYCEEKCADFEQC